MNTAQITGCLARVCLTHCTWPGPLRLKNVPSKARKGLLPPQLGVFAETAIDISQSKPQFVYAVNSVFQETNKHYVSAGGYLNGCIP